MLLALRAVLGEEHGLVHVLTVDGAGTLCAWRGIADSLPKSDRPKPGPPQANWALGAKVESINSNQISLRC